MSEKVHLWPKDCLPPHEDRWPTEPRPEAGAPLDSAATYWILAAIGIGIAGVVIWLSLE